MLARLAARSLSGVARAASTPSALAPVRAMGTAATVSETTVSCTFIMAKAKQKVTVPGMVGWTLLDTAQHHGLLMNAVKAEVPWDYVTFGEGPASAEDHIVVAREFFDKLEPAGQQEVNVLNSEVYAHKMATSRLAACVTLTKELDGITVIVPDTNPDTTNYL